MRASVTSDFSTRTIVVNVSDVADIDGTKSWHRSDSRVRMFRPDKAIIRISDGQVQELEVSGPLVKVNRELSVVRESVSWFRDDQAYGGHRLFDAPNWVRVLWDQAPNGVTSWGGPERPE